MPLGYANAGYVQSLREFGTPRHLPRSDGWLLERAVPIGGYRDAMGCYPLFFCRDWRALSDDVDALRGELIAVSLVTDPFAHIEPGSIERSFDRVVRFKNHYVADLTLPIERIVKASHRATARRAMKHVEVRFCPRPVDRLADWIGLFANLVERHRIRGIKAFSPAAFATQLAIPGMVMFEALADTHTIGLDLWYQQGDVAYGHLAAFTELGYRLRASYATKWHVLHHFTNKVRWVDFGGSIGANASNTGLTDFKAGWSTDTRPAYFCSRVLQPDAYRHVVAATGASEVDYFPAYRQGEFA